jgi:hypothetical protein
MRPGRDADHTPPSSVEVKKELSYNSTQPMGPPGLVTGFPLPFYIVQAFKLAFGAYKILGILRQYFVHVEFRKRMYSAHKQFILDDELLLTCDSIIQRKQSLLICKVFYFSSVEQFCSKEIF